VAVATPNAARKESSMPLLGHPARVRPYFGYRNTTRLRLTARALRMRERGWEHDGTLRKLSAMLRQFASQEVAGLAVTLELRARDGKCETFTEVSDQEGFVHFDVSVPAGMSSPHDPSWELGCLHWINREGPQRADAFILAPGDNYKLAVISDIDDTIIETGAGDLRRNWRRVLAQMPGDREAVPGAAKFYGKLSSGGVGTALPATRRPFFYVSSSPWNLFDYLVTFQTLHKLPQGPILLRDWDLSRATISSAGHKSHKERSIHELIEFYPDMRFALIGDNTQADALAYAAMVVAHPGRIAAVFIRQAPGADVSPEEEAAFDAIRGAGVQLWTGTSYEIGAEFLGTLGFTAGGETTQIVETIQASAPSDGVATAPEPSGASV
jgi:phosphatidate phosphatase APP1